MRPDMHKVLVERGRPGGGWGRKHAVPPSRYEDAPRCVSMSRKRGGSKYLNENLHKRSIGRDALDLRTIEPFIGALALNRVHDGTLQAFIRSRLHKDRVAVGTVNRTLAVVRRVLNLAARKWRDDQGLTWLDTSP